MRFLTSVLSARQTAILLAGITLVLRLPFVSQTLNHWDSINHALALTTYNVAAHRPQPPGYIIYIGLGRLAYFLFPDPQTALVTISVLASAGAVAFLFLLGTRMHSRAVGLIAALLLLTAPSFWFDGLVALPYVVEGCFSIVLGLLLYRLLQGEKHLAPLAAVVFAISIGARQQMIFFFAPLVVYVYWKQSWRVRLESIAWFTVVCLLWFVPLVVSAGGLTPYLDAVRKLNELFSENYVLFGTGGGGALGRNLALIGAYTLYALNLAALPLAYAVFKTLRHPIQRVWQYERVRFVVLWIAPALFFYALLHMGSPGLIYVYLSALFLVAALGVVWGARTPAGRIAAVMVLCAVNVFIFFFTPPDLYTGREIRVLNYSSLRAHDVSLRARVDAIRETFDPQTTLILSDRWRFPEYYLPEYRVLFFTGEKATPVLVTFDRQETYTTPEQAIPDLGKITTVIFFDAGANAFYKDAAHPQCLALRDGSCLDYVTIAAPHTLTLQANELAGK